MNLNLFKQKLNRDTINVINLIDSSKPDSELIRMIHNTSLKVLNHDLRDYIKANHTNFNYLDAHMTSHSCVLAHVMHKKSPELIHAVLDATEKLNDFSVFYKLFNHKDDIPLEELIHITQRCQALGLDLNATMKIKDFYFDSTCDEPQTRYYQANYLEAAIKKCVQKEEILTYNNEKTQIIGIDFIYSTNQTGIDFLNFLVASGMKKQDHEGELIAIAITCANHELIEIVCALDGIDMEYIEKGIMSWYKEKTSVLAGVDYKDTFEYQQSLKAIDYLKPCFESIKMEKLTTTATKTIKNNKKIKI